MSVATTVTFGGDLSVHDARLLYAAAIMDGAVDGPGGIKLEPEVLAYACRGNRPVRFWKETDTAEMAFPRFEAVAKSLGVAFVRHTVIESGSFPTISTTHGWRKNGNGALEVTGPADQYGRPKAAPGEDDDNISQEILNQVRNPAAVRPLLVAGGVTGIMLTREMPELGRHFLKTIVRAVMSSGSGMVAIQRQQRKYLRQERDGYTTDPREAGLFTQQEAAFITRLVPASADNRLVKAIDLIPDLMVDDRAVARERDRAADEVKAGKERQAELAMTF